MMSTRKTTTKNLPSGRVVVRVVRMCYITKRLLPGRVVKKNPKNMLCVLDCMFGIVLIVLFLSSGVLLFSAEFFSPFFGVEVIYCGSRHECNDDPRYDA